MLHQLQTTLPKLQQLTQKDFFIVTSVGKSGSTWVQKILDVHPQVYCGGEGKFQQLLSLSLQTFKKYNSALKTTNQLIYSDSPYYSDWQDTQVLSSLQFFIALTLLNAQKPIPPNVKSIGDKDIDYILNLETWHKTILPQAKIIHVIRDIRDATVSNYFHLQRQGSSISLGNQNFYHFVRVFSLTWKDAIINARRITQKTPHLYHEILYKDLKKQPQVQAKKLFQFLNIPASTKQITNCLHQASFLTQTKGRQPGQEDPNSFYRKGIVGDWKNYLDSKALNIIYQETEELLLDLGYSVSK